jgi:FkbM family methyltransferase
MHWTIEFGAHSMSDELEPVSLEDVKAEQLRRKAQRRLKRQLRHEGAYGYLNGVLAMLKPGDLAIDCGANIGVVSTQLAATGADVIGYEPDPLAFEQLTAAMTGFENVTLHNVAIGTKNDTVKLMRGQHFDRNQKSESVKSTILDGGRGIASDNFVEVELIDFTETLKREIATRGEIAFVKMDIEGAELDLLEKMHAEGLISSIRSLVVETHERKFSELRPRFKELRKVFAAEYPGKRVNLDWI